MVKPVYLYVDAGTNKVGVDSLVLAVKTKLKRQVKCISAETLLQEGLQNTNLLIIPGGEDLPYCAKLNGKGNQLIREFVEQGGYYLGICAGAYYACRQVDFIGAEYQVYGERELAFFNGTAKGAWAEFTHGNLFDETTHSKNMVFLKEKDFSHPFYYHGGPAFLPFDNTQNDAEIIAYYPNDLPAIVTGEFGEGHYLLSGVHFELQQTIYYQQIVAMCTDPVLRQQERQICRYLDNRYGNEIWRIIHTDLNAKR